MIEENSEEEKKEEVTEDTENADEKAESEEKTTPEENPDQDDFKFDDDGKEPESVTPPTKTEDKKEVADDDLLEDDKKVITEVAQKVVGEAVDKELAPLRAEREQARVDKEWSKMVTDYPELKNAEAKILRFARHESYAGKPIAQAVIDVAGIDVFLKIGAKRSKQADEEAGKTKNNGGNSSRPDEDVNGSKIPSFIGKSAQEIRDITNKVRSGQYK